MKTKILKLLILSLTIGLMAGCSDEVEVTAGDANEKPATQEQELVLPTDDTVVIEVADRNYKFSEYMFFHEQIDKRTLNFRSNALAIADRMVNNRLMAREANKIDGFEGRTGLLPRFYARIGKMWNEKYLKAVVLPMLEYARQDVMDFMPTPNDTVTIRQFVSKNQQTAEEIRQRALNGEDMEKLVTEFSEGLTAARGGLLENIMATDSRFSAEFLKELYTSTDGDVSPVMFLPIGYSFFKVVQYKTSNMWREELYPEYENKYRAERIKKLWDENLDELASKLEIVKNEETQKKYNEIVAQSGNVAPIIDDVMVTVDGMEITVRQLVDPSGTGMLHGTIAADTRMNTFIDNLIIYRAAKEKGLSDASAELAEEFLHDHLWAREYIKYRGEKIEVSKEEIEEYYEKNKDGFIIPAFNHYAVIETKTEDRLKKIYELLDSGEPFDVVAKNWSDHESKVRGGDVGMANVGSVPPDYIHIEELEKGAYAKEPVALIPDADGKPQIYTIVKMLDKTPERLRPLDGELYTSINARLYAWKKENNALLIHEELVALYGDSVKVHEQFLIDYSDSLGDVAPDYEQNPDQKPKGGGGGMHGGGMMGGGMH